MFHNIFIEVERVLVFMICFYFAVIDKLDIFNVGLFVAFR